MRRRIVGPSLDVARQRDLESCVRRRGCCMMNVLYRILSIAAIYLVAIIAYRASAGDIIPAPRIGCLITPPPSGLGLNPFYKKYCNSMDIPIISSVSDAALRQAADIVAHMLVVVPDVRKRLVTNNVRVAVIGELEKTTDIPEYRPLKGNADADAARGFGAAFDIPVASGAEENLLCLPIERDSRSGENIFVHEFGHTIKEMGIEETDRRFRARVQQAYKKARRAELWEHTYSINNAMTNDPVKYAEEYWAEGVQSYFDANRFVDPPNGIHNAINTRTKLKQYDRPLYNLINRAFHGTTWRPHCP
jgi:hypothetical protein